MIKLYTVYLLFFLELEQLEWCEVPIRIVHIGPSFCQKITSFNKCSKQNTILIYLFLFSAPGHICTVFFRCERCIRDPAPGGMRYTYIFIASALRV